FTIRTRFVSNDGGDAGLVPVFYVSRRVLLRKHDKGIRVSTETPETARETTTATGTMPVLPLRDVVVYPHMVIPLFVGREKSILALDQAMRSGKQILLVAQKQADIDDPGANDL